MKLVDELKVAILLPTAGESLVTLHKALLGCFSQTMWRAPAGAGPREQIRILVRTSVGTSLFEQLHSFQLFLILSVPEACSIDE
jgi:hypothetical protein